MSVKLEGASSTFHSIGQDVYLSRSHDNSNSDLRESAPTLILIFGWMGAKLPHLHKYTKIYEELYPDAAKVLIKCEPSFFWSRETTRQAKLAPAVEALRALGYLPPLNKGETLKRPVHCRVLIHAFSNGGCSQLLCLGRLITSQHPGLDITERNAAAIVYDSSPGLGNLEQSKRAFTTLVRNKFLRRIMNVIMTVWFIYFAIMRRLFGQKNIAEVLKADLNQPRLLPWVDGSSPRLYIYSKRDEMVPYTEVEGHIRNAKAAGFDVRSEVFEDTPHVSHARLEPTRYWAAVQETWEDACSKVEMKCEQRPAQ